MVLREMSDEDGGLVEQFRVGVFASDEAKGAWIADSADPIRGRLRIASGVAASKNPATSM